MAPKHAPRRTRTRSIETLEERRFMTADPVAPTLGGSIEAHSGGPDNEPPALVQHQQRDGDFWIDPWAEQDIGGLAGDIEQTLASAHAATGLLQPRNDYGFIGTGQTVAIIDSGIAWDHYALGGGLGSNYRVVGGWDFTGENDANPYDDGPSGSHGTHVAGIVGSDKSGTNDDGVVPGVDLVGLRVFDDAGAGYFNWVENALSWVHQNRNSFENPITAVNLSLGTSWNSSSIPSWATLENEFAQLEADGIFISVSAGNSFTTYNASGLSYPAASPYVVPVMSVDDNGSLSSFSQRHTRAIAAPGRYITSTVPDYVGNHNGVTDDFASFSGTSMAAPYVAGASVLVREAMQFVGRTNITQDVIFDHMMSTATSFFDAATSQTYKRLNLGNALNSLMPTDDYGSTSGAAFNLGTLSGSSEVAGLIGKVSDADYFRFTAAANGTVEFTATTTHGMRSVWTGTGGTVSGTNGQTFMLNVVAGQTYTVGLSSSTGIGYFDLAVEAEASVTYVDWGTVTQVQLNNIANTGEKWYRVQASQAGYMTAEAFFADAAGNVDLAWFNGSMQQVATGVSATNSERIDWQVNAGDQLYLRVSGSNSDVDFRLTNLVSMAGSTVNVSGTSQNDTLTFTGGGAFTVTVNGTAYSFSSSAVSKVEFDGKSGSDTLTVKSGNVSALRATGVETLADLDSRAYSLDQDLGLRYSSSYFENWAGFGEKWVLGNDSWYFVTTDGALYRWTGGASLASNTLVGQLDASYHTDSSLVHNAQVTGVMLDHQMLGQVANSGLKLSGSYHQNWGGWNEKWVLSDAGQWYFVTPNGTLYQWNGGSGCAGSTVIGNIGSKFHTNPGLLQDAAELGTFSSQIAGQLNTNCGLHFQTSYCTNWGGWGEKWIKGSNSDWYFITPSGGLYQWSGSANLGSSRLVASLDSSYHATPSRLHDAALSQSVASNVHAESFAQFEDNLSSVAGQVAAVGQIAGQQYRSMERTSTRLTAATNTASLGSRAYQIDNLMDSNRHATCDETDSAIETIVADTFGESSSSAVDEAWLDDIFGGDDAASRQAVFESLDA